MFFSYLSGLGIFAFQRWEVMKFYLMYGFVLINNNIFSLHNFTQIHLAWSKKKRRMVKNDLQKFNRDLIWESVDFITILEINSN